MSKLIITADDYGLNNSVNKAILQAVSAGLVTSVHVLTNYADEVAIKQLAKAIAEGGNKCGIGFHANTTAGPAVTNEENGITRWNNQNQRFQYRDLLDWNYQKADLTAIKRDLTMQFEKLADLLGGADKIDCISSHHNIHLFDADMLSFLETLSAKGKIPFRSTVRWEVEKGNPSYKGDKKGSPIKESAKKTLAGCIKNKNLRTVGLLTNAADKDKMMDFRASVNNNPKSGTMINSTSGHWYGQPSKKAIDWMIEQLLSKNNKQSDYAVEIFMHLSDSDKLPDSQKNDVLTYDMSNRKMEFLTLMNQDIKTMLNHMYNDPNVRFGSYRKLTSGVSTDYSKII